MNLTLEERKALEEVKHNYKMIELEKSRQNMREEQRLIMSNLKLKSSLI